MDGYTRPNKLAAAQSPSLRLILNPIAHNLQLSVSTQLLMVLHALSRAHEKSPIWHCQLPRHRHTGADRVDSNRVTATEKPRQLPRRLVSASAPGAFACLPCHFLN